jgi:hypothetical protein
MSGVRTLLEVMIMLSLIQKQWDTEKRSRNALLCLMFVLTLASLLTLQDKLGWLL